MCGDYIDEGPEPAATSEDFPWHLGVYDVHNHIGERIASVKDIPSMRARCVVIMATRSQDQALIAEAATSLGFSNQSEFTESKTASVIPGFGRHPWFSHELYDDTASEPTFCHPGNEEQLEEAKMKHYAAVLTPAPSEPAFVADLPTPEPLSQFIEDTRQRLISHPLAMIGEIGLDKPFRLAIQWNPEAKLARDPARTPGGRERRPLSRHNIAINHQKVVFKAHLKLAGELRRAVSVHGVQVHGLLFDMLVESWKGHEKKSKRKAKAQQGTEEKTQDTQETLSYPPRICLHSFSGKADAVQQYLSPRFPAAIFFSFSRSNNMRDDIGLSKMTDALKMIPDDRLLVESDIHTAGDKMDADLEEAYRMICKLKGWTLEHGVQRIGDNWRHFVFGEEG